MIISIVKMKLKLSKPFHNKHAKGEYDKKLPKVFVIGHNKTATRSIDLLFKLSNYRALHWDKNNLTKTIRSNFKSNLPLLTYIDDYHCYSDMEIPGEFYAYELFPLFDLQYPNSLFIYNKRQVSDWITSRKNHGTYANDYQKKFNSRNHKKLMTIKEVEQHWKQFFENHEKRILTYFKGKDNLFQLDIESKQSQQDLIQHLRNTGFKIKESLKLLPITGVTAKT